jgi:hypothetical protein
VTDAQEVSVKTSGVQVGAPSLPSWQLFALAGLIGATLVVFVSRGQPPAAIILLSLVVFAAAAVGAAALRTLLPFIGAGERLDVPLAGGRARVAIEREKTLALRAIKDLEFDHAMGKVSDQDFAEMSGRLRTRAAGLDAAARCRSVLLGADRTRADATARSRGAPPPAAGPGPGASARSAEPRTTRPRASARSAGIAWVPA